MSTQLNVKKIEGQHNPYASNQFADNRVESIQKQCFRMELSARTNHKKHVQMQHSTSDNNTNRLYIAEVHLALQMYFSHLQFDAMCVFIDLRQSNDIHAAYKQTHSAG